MSVSAHGRCQTVLLLWWSRSYPSRVPQPQSPVWGWWSEVLRECSLHEAHRKVILMHISTHTELWPFWSYCACLPQCGRYRWLRFSYASSWPLAEHLHLAPGEVLPLRWSQPHGEVSRSGLGLILVLNYTQGLSRCSWNYGVRCPRRQP